MKVMNAAAKILTSQSASATVGDLPLRAARTYFLLTRAFGASTALPWPHAFLLPAFVVRSAPCFALLVRSACRRLRAHASRAKGSKIFVHAIGFARKKSAPIWAPVSEPRRTL